MMEKCGDKTTSKAVDARKDELFADKLALLQLYYPKYLKESLSELLIGCSCDVEAVRGVLSGSVAKKRIASTQGSLMRVKERKVGGGLGNKGGFGGDPGLDGGLGLGASLEGDSGFGGDLEEGSRIGMKSTNLSNSENHKTPSNVSKLSIYRPKGNKITLNTPQDVQNHLSPYVSLHLNFLPTQIAESLLSELMECRHSFKSNRFYLFGNQCELSHLLGMFSRPQAAYAKLVYNGLRRSTPTDYTPIMEEACVRLEKFVNEEIIPNEPKPIWNIEAERKQKNEEQQQEDEPKFYWTSDFCLVNCYEKLQNKLDWHSDRLSHIGPLNYVVSLSLGSTRVFSLRNNHQKDAPTYHIPLPHNSVLLMKPGCQEEFKHCVQSMKRAITVHKTANSLRFGITARHYPPFFIENLPKCRCNLGMILRRSYKSVATRGQYFWSCENVYQNKDCGQFHWADFNNVCGHYIAKDKRSVSTWIAPEDEEKLLFDKRNQGLED